MHRMTALVSLKKSSCQKDEVMEETNRQVAYTRMVIMIMILRCSFSPDRLSKTLNWLACATEQPHITPTPHCQKGPILPNKQHRTTCKQIDVLLSFKQAIRQEVVVSQEKAQQCYRQLAARESQYFQVEMGTFGAKQEDVMKSSRPLVL